MSESESESESEKKKGIDAHRPPLYCEECEEQFRHLRHAFLIRTSNHLLDFSRPFDFHRGCYERLSNDDRVQWFSRVPEGSCGFLGFLLFLLVVVIVSVAYSKEEPAREINRIGVESLGRMRLQALSPTLPSTRLFFFFFFFFPMSSFHLLNWRAVIRVTKSILFLSSSFICKRQ